MFHVDTVQKEEKRNSLVPNIESEGKIWTFNRIWNPFENQKVIFMSNQQFIFLKMPNQFVRS